MVLKRYNNDLTLDGGRFLATNESIRLIRRAIERGELQTADRILKEGERLDGIAGKVYGDGSLWWIIAAASGIGWWTQVPPGTLIRVPTDLNYLKSLFG
jgi:nucleoid-associated protein YgaU